MIFLEENFKWHLEVFASELFIQKYFIKIDRYFNSYGAKKKKKTAQPHCTTIFN